jgi:hypothetical protein
VLFILWFIYVNPQYESKREIMHAQLGRIGDVLERLRRRDMEMDAAKSEVIDILHLLCGRNAPNAQYVATHHIIQTMLNRTITHLNSDEHLVHYTLTQTRKCVDRDCSIYNIPCTSTKRRPTYVVHIGTDPDRAEGHIPTSMASTIQRVLYYDAPELCQVCRAEYTSLTAKMDNFPFLLFVEMTGWEQNMNIGIPTIDNEVLIENTMYDLIAAIYGGPGHFIARVKGEHNIILKYDGIAGQDRVTPVKSISELFPLRVPGNYFIETLVYVKRL